MSLRILIDMNLSLEWVGLLHAAGHDAVHWSEIGDPQAPDITLMEWAEANGHLVLTHDLDFGTALALTHAVGPSVLQVRGRGALTEQIGPIVLTALIRYERELAVGALVVLQPDRSRVRVLPL